MLSKTRTQILKDKKIKPFCYQYKTSLAFQFFFVNIMILIIIFPYWFNLKTLTKSGLKVKTPNQIKLEKKKVHCLQMIYLAHLNNS